MSTLTLAGMRTQAQLLVNDPTAAYLTQATWTALVNEKYIWYRDQMDTNRNNVVSNTTLFNATPVVGANTTIATNYKKILQLIPQSSPSASAPVAYQAAPKTTPIERVPMSKISDLSASAPLYPAYALERQPGMGGKWTIWLTQGVIQIATPGVTYLSAIVLIEPTPLAADSDIGDLTDHESYMVARMAAVEGARLIGKDPQYIANIAMTLPDEVKVALGIEGFARRPQGEAGSF